MKPKVFLLLTDLENPKYFGGIQMYNRSLIGTLEKQNVAHAFLTLNDINSYGCGKNKVRFVARFYQKVFAYKPTLIICGHINFALLCYSICKMLNIPYYVTCHGIDAIDMSRSKIYALQRAKRLLHVSEYTKNNVQQQTKNSDDTFCFLPPCIDSNKFTPTPRPQHLMKKWNLNKDDKIILTICRLSKEEMYKGYDTILSVLHRVAQKVKNVRYIIGGSGDDIGRIKDIIVTENLHDKVITTGFIPDEEITNYYNLCDVFAMPSKKEGFGIVFTEASCCGKPNLAGNKDGSSDAVLYGKTGVLVDPDSSEQVEEALVQILSNKARPQLYDGDYLRSEVINAYSHSAFEKRLADILSLT
ncbi:glycosyltransferase family 4 protein [Candidatus Uabimicrobium amorphum]|uniref:Glycoside hydrolase n=1 Tax=Uabimicrobium amorphum TaxID=2596890 RepID=A0A5S9F7J2_UABAM|nr:glycosyltransferase family 4 protein [Candidatus Uabimicrobium amorphum]BBM87694.1 glycoside hydrolase [Candidatus Uabimicrobium amorphum]